MTTSTENSDCEHVFVGFVAARPEEVAPAAHWWICEGAVDWMAGLMPGPDRHDEALTHYWTAWVKGSRTSKRSGLPYPDDNGVTEIIRLSFKHSHRNSLGQDTSCFCPFEWTIPSFSFTGLAYSKKKKKLNYRLLAAWHTATHSFFSRLILAGSCLPESMVEIKAWQE